MAISRRRLPAVTVVLSAAFTLPVAAAARSFTIEDYGSLVGVSDPQISPDGKQIAVVVSRPDLSQDKNLRTLEIVDVARGTFASVAAGNTSVGSPRWSPDGSELAFVRPGEGKDAEAQVWMMPLGGTPRQVSNAKNGVDLYAWRPDGKALAYVTGDDPPNERAIQRHDDLFQVGDDSFTTRAAPTPLHVWVQPLGGQAERLTQGTWSVYPDNISWSADGRYIAFTQTPDAHHDSLFTHPRIAVVDASSKRVSQIGDRWAWSPAFAPSGGDRVAFTEGAHGSRLLQQELMVASVGSSSVQRAAPSLDRNVQYFAWLPSGDFIVGADDRISTPMWIVRRGLAHRLDMQGVNAGEATAARNGAVAIVGATARDPSELYYLGPGAERLQRLSNYNAHIAALDVAPSRELTWGNGGFTEDGVLTYPLGYQRGKTYPLALVVHGGPTFEASTDSFSSLGQVLAAHGMFVLEPNYRGSDNLGFVYARAIYGENPAFGAGSDCLAGVKAAEATGAIDSSRIGVSGWSAGGWMTSWLIARYDLWKAAVTGAAIDDAVMQYTLSEISAYMPILFNGLTPWTPRGWNAYRRNSPITYARNVKAPTLILSDIGDGRAPAPQAFEFFKALHDLGKTVEFVVIPVSGHHPSDPVRRQAVDQVWSNWLIHYLTR